MRQLAFLAAVITLGAACSKKSPPGSVDAGGIPGTKSVETVDDARARLLNQLRSTNDKARFDAAEELGVWAETDPQTVEALIALLSDKTTAGSGKTHPMRITSIREAAARALALAGPKGEAALKEKGLAALREGLNDPNSTVREHSAYTIGLLGPLARSLSPDVMKLCTHPDSNVRGMAFDALRSIGVTDIPGFVPLLNHENADIGQLAAELVPGLHEVPDSAIPVLIEALKSKTEPIRIAAAEGLAIAGTRAAPAVAALAAALKTSYPAEYDPEAIVVLGPEMAYWRALVKIGEPAVSSTTELLGQTNALVRAFAARTLGELGASAKPAAGKLREALKDRFGFVAVEAACALCRIGEGKNDAVDLVKRAIDAPNNVAQTAIEAIPRMGDAGKPLVGTAVAKLRSDNPYAKYAAIGLVVTLEPDEAMKHAAELGRLVNDDLAEIRQRAAFVLEKLGPAGSPAADSLAKALLTETDESLRDRYVDALIAIGSGAKPALPALLPLATDRSLPVNRRERVIAAVATADPSSQDVAKTLVEVAGDPDQSVRAAAASGLGRLDPLPPEALAKLVAIAKTDKRTDPRAAALRALAHAGRRAKSARSEIEMIAIGKQQDGLALLAKVAIAAIDGDSATAAAAIRAGLVDKRPDLRAAATRALLDVGPKSDDMPALLRSLSDRDDATRESAVRCLGKLGPVAKEAVPRLAKLLIDDVVGDVRDAAANTLGEIGPAALPAAPKLRQAARDDRVVEPAARKALEKLGFREKK